MGPWVPGAGAAWVKVMHLTSWSCSLHPSDLGTKYLTECSAPLYRQVLKWNRGALQPDLAPCDSPLYSLWACLPQPGSRAAPVVATEAEGRECEAWLALYSRMHAANHPGAYPAHVCCGDVCRAAQSGSRAAQAPNSRVSGASRRWDSVPVSALSSSNPQPTPAPSPPAAAASTPTGTQRARRNSGKVSFASSAPAEGPTGRGSVP